MDDHDRARRPARSPHQEGYGHSGHRGPAQMSHEDGHDGGGQSGDTRESEIELAGQHTGVTAMARVAGTAPSSRMDRTFEAVETPGFATANTSTSSSSTR